MTLALYDLVFGLIAFALFDFLLEDCMSACTARACARCSSRPPLPMTLALGLVFFWAPAEAEQGFLQKIFYVHVPLAIVALCGFVPAG